MRVMTKVLLAASLLAVGGCNTYSYIDFEAKLDPSYSVTSAQSIVACRMFVTGAATDDFVIPTLHDDHTQWCPPTTPDITRVNYSTFAESGDLVFTFKGFGNGGCLLADGSTTVKIIKGMTSVGGDLKVTPKMPVPVCQ